MLESPRAFLRGKLFFSVLTHKDEYESTLNLIDRKWGVEASLIPEFSPLISYYEKEMGTQLFRGLVLCKETYERADLWESKDWAQFVESDFVVNGKRRVNLDPGHVYLEQTILSTTKPFAHRVYTGKYWAELVYTFEKGHFRPLPWTYPDYRHPEKLDWFNQIRRDLLALSKSSP